ncbi:MAG: arginase family protein [Peptostreptococcales bacterium]
MSFHEMMDIILSFKSLNVIGADIVELAPHYDPSGVSTAIACKVMRELLLTILGN